MRYCILSMQGRSADGCLAGCSWFTQFWVLLRRAMLGQLRNPTDTTSRLFLSTWVGVLAGERCAVMCSSCAPSLYIASSCAAWNTSLG